jgi:hypothetical protein
LCKNEHDKNENCLFCCKVFDENKTNEFTNFCNLSCRQKYSKYKGLNINRIHEYKINKKPEYCVNCKKDITFDRNKRFCSKYCHTYFQKHDPETNKKARENCSKGGLSSMKVQNRRSQNEIMFFEKCVEYFGEENVISNERIFDGDDADIIIHSIKYAIEWNGEWHYNKDLNRHAGSKLEKDCAKVANFAKCGYTPYVIKDRSCASKNRVDFEFKKFIKTIKNKKRKDIERETIVHCLMESIMFNVISFF